MNKQMEKAISDIQLESEKNIAELTRTKNDLLACNRTCV